MLPTQDITDTLGFFSRQDLLSIPDTKERIDALLSFCVNTHAIEIEAYVRRIGGESIQRLKKLQEMIEDCRDFLIQHHKEISDQYELGRLRPWLTQYSLDHLDEDVLYIYHGIIDEDGTCEFPENIQPMPWENLAPPIDISEYDPDPDTDLEPGDADTHDYDASEDSQMGNSDEEDSAEDLESLYPPLSEEELLRRGFSIGLAIENPFKRERADMQFMDKLGCINYTANIARVLIDQYLSSHPERPESASLADYAEVIAPVINGEVFNEPIDGILLEKVLSARGRFGLSIMKRREARWTRILWEFYQYGPEACTNKQWIESIAEVWGLQKDLKNRPYDAPLDRPDVVLETVKEKMSEVKGSKNRSGK